MYNGRMQQSRRQGTVQAKVLTVAQVLASYIRNPTEHSTESDMLLGVNLSDGEWSEYDEKAAASVGILNLEHGFVVTK